MERDLKGDMMALVDSVLDEANKGHVLDIKHEIMEWTCIRFGAEQAKEYLKTIGLELTDRAIESAYHKSQHLGIKTDPRLGTECKMAEYRKFISMIGQVIQLLGGDNERLLDDIRIYANLISSERADELLDLLGIGNNDEARKAACAFLDNELK